MKSLSFETFLYGLCISNSKENLSLLKCFRETSSDCLIVDFGS